MNRFLLSFFLWKEKREREEHLLFHLNEFLIKKSFISFFLFFFFLIFISFLHLSLLFERKREREEERDGRKGEKEEKENTHPESISPLFVFSRKNSIKPKHMNVCVCLSLQRLEREKSLSFPLHKSNTNTSIQNQHNKITTTVNNGYLGSCIDEERSKVRKVMWNAKSCSLRKLRTWIIKSLNAIGAWFVVWWSSLIIHHQACLFECWKFISFFHRNGNAIRILSFFLSHPLRRRRRRESLFLNPKTISSHLLILEILLPSFFHLFPLWKKEKNRKREKSRRFLQQREKERENLLPHPFSTFNLKSNKNTRWI